MTDEEIEKLSTWQLAKMVPGALADRLVRAVLWAIMVYVFREDPKQVAKEWYRLAELEEKYPGLSDDEVVEIVLDERGRPKLSDEEWEAVKATLFVLLGLAFVVTCIVMAII